MFTSVDYGSLVLVLYKICSCSFVYQHTVALLHRRVTSKVQTNKILDKTALECTEQTGQWIKRQF
jgi:hypothetical protein